MILVAGGTGALGSRIANRLCQRGLPVRVMSRGTRLGHPLEPGVEVRTGDVRRRASVDEAMRGVTTVVSAVHGFVGPGGVSPASVDRLGNGHLVDAAAEVGSDVVLMSVLGASADGAMELSRMKYAAEQHLFAGPCAWTVVRAAPFAQTWITLLEDTAGRSRRPMVFGDGRNPIPWVDIEDVAALAEKSVLDRSLRGRVLEIAGPESLGLAALASLVMTRHGWTGSPRRCPRPALQVVAQTLGRLAPGLGRKARAALAMDTMATVDCRALRAEFAGLRWRTVSAVLAGA
jgi:uncharacterized protein YbjT (DUF2867 family)